MRAEQPGPEHVAALAFLRAVWGEDVEGFWNALSGESKAFVLGYWHGHDLIGGAQVHNRTLGDALIREGVGLSLAEDRRKLIEAWGADFLETMGVAAGKRHSEDGLRAEVLFVADHGASEVIYIASTEVRALRVPMVLELDFIANEASSCSWRVDYLTLWYGRPSDGAKAEGQHSLD